MVSEMRVPSSSNSSSVQHVRTGWGRGGAWVRGKPTDGEGLDLNAILDVRGGWVVRLLMGQNRLAAKRVHEGRPAYM